jgi:hypothetical protein
MLQCSMQRPCCDDDGGGSMALVVGKDSEMTMPIDTTLTTLTTATKMMTTKRLVEHY